MAVTDKPGNGTDAEKSPQDRYDILLMDYASGALDEAHSLVVAAHLSLSPKARTVFSRYESIGGALLNSECPPVEMKEDALDCVFKKIDALLPSCAEKINACNKARALLDGMPSCLQLYVEKNSCCSWSKLAPGTKALTIRTGCKGPSTHLIRIEAGGLRTMRIKKGDTVSLIISGACEDSGRRYERGDILIVEQTGSSPFADQSLGCVYLSVTTPQSRHWIYRLFPWC